MSASAHPMKVREAYPGDAAAIAQVHVRSWQETYKGLMPAEFLARLSVERRHLMWARSIGELGTSPQTKAIYVIEDDKAIRGFVAVGREREELSGFDAEIYAIYLLKEFQGIGAGRALFDRAMLWLAANGYKKMRLWVLDTNPTRRFYEHVGGKLQDGSKTIEIEGQPIQEVAYAWDVSAPAPA